MTSASTDRTTPKTLPPLTREQGLARLRQQIDAALGDLLANAGKLAILEFPAHPNVGDSAIWLGEIAFLASRHKRSPSLTADPYSYSPERLAAIRNLDAILIHGGGNLGDLWPGLLDSKIRVLQDFPDRTVIQLPQTVYFRDPGRLDAYRRAVAGHRRFTLLVRDQASFETASAAFDCEVRLCPDTAFHLDLKRPAEPTREIVGLLRTDLEASAQQGGWRDGAAGGLAIVDWLEEPRARVVDIERKLTEKVALHPRKLAGLEPVLTALRNRVAWTRVRRGCRLLAAGKVVVTDRLHGHILCLLMGIPHVVLDNSYGKVSQFCATWTGDFPGVRFADSLDEAVDLARGLAAIGE